MKGFLNFFRCLLMAFFVVEQRTLVLHIGANDYQDFLDECANERTPGTTQIIYAAPYSEILSWPALLGTTGIGEPLTLDGNITFKTTPTGVGYWRKIKIVADTGQVDDDYVGELGSKAYKTMLKFRLAGTSVENRDFRRRLLSQCNIFLVESRENPGSYMVFGSPTDPCVVDESKLTTGAVVGSGVTGSTFTFRDPSGKPIVEYSGTLDLTPNV